MNAEGPERRRSFWSVAQWFIIGPILAGGAASILFFGWALVASLLRQSAAPPKPTAAPAAAVESVQPESGTKCPKCVFRNERERREKLRGFLEEAQALGKNLEDNFGDVLKASAKQARFWPGWLVRWRGRDYDLLCRFDGCFGEVAPVTGDERTRAYWDVRAVILRWQIVADDMDELLRDPSQLRMETLERDRKTVQRDARAARRLTAK